MAYGKNITTSRLSAVADYRQLMLKKLIEASPPEISRVNDDPEAWESTGAPRGEEKIGKVYQVELDTTGKAIWREIKTKAPEIKGERFGLSSSVNGWGCTSMTPIAKIPGLFAAEIVIGNLGQEFFHVLCDEDPSLVYRPVEGRANSQLAKVMGPDRIVGAPEDASWCVSAEPGSRFRIEFYISKRGVSVTWLRVRQNRALC
eukprot:TRINITY_DN33575_c0_g1_i1.p1 TRINITY_DN33575_c0_g1~~TRINITY_DN33575_c0_g1_i1.p1  ORF type:complete len:232 (-),score=38.14 TRINITY_DN33575_c0_g1_i1:242-847(-)